MARVSSRHAEALIDWLQLCAGHPRASTRPGVLQYPAITALWERTWAEFVPFLGYSAEIRRVIYSTNAIESLNARMRRATRARGHFLNEQAAFKCLYLVIRSLDPTGRGAHRWMNRWKPALNAFAIAFGAPTRPHQPMTTATASYTGNLTDPLMAEYI